jgi:hypothetical protein
MRKDLDFTFRPHPLTGDLVIKTGSSAIKQSIKNIVLTNFGDRGYNVELGTNIDYSLFENITLTTGQQIRDNIINSIRNFEPQVEIIDVEVYDDGDNEIKIKIYYNELNNPSEQTLNIDLTRIR